MKIVEGKYYRFNGFDGLFRTTNNGLVKIYNNDLLFCYEARDLHNWCGHFFYKGNVFLINEVYLKPA